MALEIRDTKTTPKEKFWSYPAVDGSLLSTNSHMNIGREVAMHYSANGHPVPDEQTITRYLCDHLTIPCFEDGKPYGNPFTNPPTYAKRGKPSPDWGLLSPLKLLAKEGDRGLGDIVARKIGPIGGDAFKEWYKKIFGKSCGCSERQEDWNLQYPL